VWIQKRKKVLLPHLEGDQLAAVSWLDGFLLLFYPLLLLVDVFQQQFLPSVYVFPFLVQVFVSLLQYREHYTFLRENAYWSDAFDVVINCLWARTLGGVHAPVIIAAYTCSNLGMLAVNRSFVFTFLHFFLGFPFFYPFFYTLIPCLFMSVFGTSLCVYVLRCQRKCLKRLRSRFRALVDSIWSFLSARA
jgi:hypothetical protein